MINKPFIIKEDENGERIELTVGSGLCSSNPVEGNFNTDLTVCSGDFSRFDPDEHKWVNYSINSENIAGIEICGVYFEVTEIK